MSDTAPTNPTSEGVVTYVGVVHGVDCDLMGHLNTARYAAMYDSATWSMLNKLGFRWRADAPLGWVDVRNVIEYEREVPVDSAVRIVTRVKRVGEKSMTLLHELQTGDPWQRNSTFEAVLVQFDNVRRCSTRIPDEHRAEISKYL
ncbi:acyl-CoA thioesterase [Steroidobacter sp.]|uniref:acyl-CoA thioesterase n=1 Tax=Steroidobacter sp. TaxID=1978227 RepID=UPI001A60A544|nr:thioesterase family protein [Steroidobacter sp.]MBL8266303.1 thioesterase family protein [Steroidobacter sp.]